MFEGQYSTLEISPWNAQQHWTVISVNSKPWKLHMYCLRCKILERHLHLHPFSPSVNVVEQTTGDISQHWTSETGGKFHMDIPTVQTSFSKIEVIPTTGCLKKC